MEPKPLKKNKNERHLIFIVKGDCRFDADLCCFCLNQHDLSGKEKCVHYDDYQGDQCDFFEKHPDQKQRMEDLFDVRCENSREV